MRERRIALGVVPTFKTVDTCGAEFDAETPYHYSTYEDDDEVERSGPREGPDPRFGAESNRAGDRVRLLLRARQLRAVRGGLRDGDAELQPRDRLDRLRHLNDRLYFEPLTFEDAMNVIESEQASGDLVGVVVALGGQTPLKLAGALPDGLVLGTSPASIDRAEDRDQWNRLCNRLEIPQPPGGTATDVAGALEIVDQVGYPVLMRPSYVLGGRAMEIVYDEDSLRAAMDHLAGFGSLGKEGGLSAERPVLIDRFLEDATEVDVDAIRDHTGEVLIGGIMEHVEEAGVHSGDSACSLPPYSLSAETCSVIEAHTEHLAAELDVRGLINVQYAVKDGQVFVIEANPRASRTVPFVAKATGVPLVKIASRVMVGATLQELRKEGLVRTPVSAVTSRSRKRSCPSTGSPEATPCSVPRCVRPAR